MSAFDDDSGQSPRNGAGHIALTVGVAAIALTLLPVVGEFLAIPVALVATIAGFIGFDRADRGHATNRGDAVVGGGLGVLSLLVNLAMLAAVHGGA